MQGSIAIIGAGTMGSAFVRELSAALGAERLRVCDRHAEKLDALPAGIRTSDPAAAARGADVVILAVKPQSFEALAKELAGSLGGALAISIMAGVPLARLSEALGVAAIVRAMPNLGTRIGRSLTGWVAGRGVTEAQREDARAIFRAAGAEMELADEGMLDAFTALAGSGPAYFFLLADLLEQSALRLGFDAARARAIARETFVGSALLLDAGGESDAAPISPAEWIRSVASKGGTTEAALRVFESGGLDELFARAMDAAAARSRDLSNA